ncbi:MAG: ABC transporter ATP-binding protein [Chlorobiaceae bacterium]
MRGKGRAEQGFRYGDILFFWKFVKPLWRLGLASLLLTVLSTALGSVLPLSVKVVVDCIIMKKGVTGIGVFFSSHHLAFLAGPAMHLAGSLNVMVITILIVGALIGLIGVIEKLISQRFQQEITFNAQTTLFEHVLRFPLSIIKEKQVGYLMSRVSGDVGMLQFFFSRALPQLMTNVFYCLFGFMILFALDRTIFLVLLWILPALFVVNYFFASRARAVSYREMERSAEVSRDMQEVISGAEVVKSSVAEKSAAEKVSGRLRELFSIRLYSTLLTTVSGSLTQTAKLVVTLIIVVLGVHGIERGAMTIGDLTTALAYVVSLSGKLTGISSTVLSFQSVFASMGRLMELFETVPENDVHADLSLVRPVEIKGTVEFSGVSFSYNTDKTVLDGISCIAHPGETIAIMGESGAGKTTLVNLLLKFHRPSSGTISIDGYDLQLLDTSWWRMHVGIVSQDVFLFNDTIENNIKYGSPEAGSDDVVRAAKLAHIHDDIMLLPQRYETKVGERGGAFSLGQRQRISIARAFLKDPAILILDEPSSALDSATEALLWESLGELAKNRTTFIISHRLSVAGIADRVFRLDGRKIRELDT